MSNFSELDGHVRDSFLTGYVFQWEHYEQSVFDKLDPDAVSLGVALRQAVMDVMSMADSMRLQRQAWEKDNPGVESSSFTLTKDFELGFHNYSYERTRLARQRNLRKYFDCANKINKIYGDIVFYMPYGYLDDNIYLGLHDIPWLFNTVPYARGGE